jgi:hypothetical protein
LIFGNQRGYLCLAKKIGRSFLEEYFSYPEQLDDALRWIDAAVLHNDLYFCPHLFKDKDYRRPSDNKGPRVKENVNDEITALWADLDYCHPAKLRLEPSIVLETSPDRFQALWLLDEPIDKITGEEICHRIAVAHHPVERRSATGSW